MTDPRHVADALAALADGTAPESVAYRTVVADAADAATDVRDAAQFVADGGRARLRLAVRTAERVGDRDAAEDGRRTLDALARFRAAAAGDAAAPTAPASADSTAPASADSTAPASAADATDTAGPPPTAPGEVDRSLPLRSRNDFTRRRSTTARRK